MKTSDWFAFLEHIDANFNSIIRAHVRAYPDGLMAMRMYDQWSNVK